MPVVVSLVPEERFVQTGVELPGDWDFKFVTDFSEDGYIEACRGADFLLVPSAFLPCRVTGKVIENIPTVKMIQMEGAGYDVVDIEAAAEVNLPVANNAGHNAGAVVELCIGLIVALQRRILESDREIKAGNYSGIREEITGAGIPEINGSRLGILGMGAIGRELARVAGMLSAQLAYYDVVRLKEDVEAELGVSFKPFERLLAESDIISVHVPLVEGTRNMIGRREFKLMPRGAIFLNTSRGEVVDQAALAEALESGHLGGAGIDTLSPEPPPADHPLLNLSDRARDRLIMTPHVGGVTVGSFRRMLRGALANMARVAAGEPPRSVVNGVLKARG